MQGFSLMYLGQLEGIGLVAPTCLTGTCCFQPRRLVFSYYPTRTPREDGKQRLVCLLHQVNQNAGYPPCRAPEELKQEILNSKLN